MAFDALARVQKQHGQTFAIGVEMWMRGDVQSVGVAQETDIKLGDVPVEAGLRVEVVDATGGTVWSSARGADAGRLKIAKELEQGSYFVRLYDGGGKLLHEYGFRVSSGIR